MKEENANMNTTSIDLIIEGQDGALWGRVLHGEHLMVDHAKSVAELEGKMKDLLVEFHEMNANEIQFRIEYDLTAFFEEFRFLNITEIAKASGLNGSLVRQYASGKKFPSAKQAEKLESVVRNLGQKLANVHIYAR